MTNLGLALGLLLSLNAGCQEKKRDAADALSGGAQMKMLVSFEETGQDWRVIDDGVMGGRSQGSWRVEGGRGVFAGTLSLENNGGFSSVRSTPLTASCDGATAFCIRVRGDGRRYQFRVRTNKDFDGASYRSHFETVKDEWLEVELPLRAFEASFRGRVLLDYPPLAAEDVVTVGFLLADKQAGPFRLEVEWIGLLEAGSE